MTPADPTAHGLLGAYALGAVDERERVAVRAHLVRCAECRGDLDELAEVAAALAATTPAPPPAGVRLRVMSGISRVRPLPPVPPVPAGSAADTTAGGAAGAPPAPSPPDVDRRRGGSSLARARARIGIARRRR